MTDVSLKNGHAVTNGPKKALWFARPHSECLFPSQEERKGTEPTIPGKQALALSTEAKNHFS